MGASVGVVVGPKTGKSTLVGPVVGALVGDLVGALVGPLAGQGSLSPALCVAQPGPRESAICHESITQLPQKKKLNSGTVCPNS